jgi:hypothetical protein
MSAQACRWVCKPAQSVMQGWSQGIVVLDSMSLRCLDTMGCDANSLP